MSLVNDLDTEVESVHPGREEGGGEVQPSPVQLTWLDPCESLL